MNPKKQIANTLTVWQNTPVLSRHSIKHLPVLIIVVAILCGASYLTGRYLVGKPAIYSGPPEPTPASVEVASEPTAPAPAATPVPQPTRQEKLQKLIDDFAATQDANFYVYVKDLKTGDTASIGASKSVPSGSIYKLFLANQVYKLVEAGKLSMHTPVSGTGYTYQGCTMQMVQNSLNACGEAVRNQLGAVAQTKDLNKQGYKGTNLMHAGAAHTSPADIALLYQRLYDGGYFSKAHTAEFLGYLRRQMWRFRIPTGVPVEPLATGKTVVLNKTGDVYDYANDGAILYGENTDAIVVIMSNGWSKVFPDSSYSIRHLSGLIYNFLNNTNYPLPYTSL